MLACIAMMAIVTVKQTLVKSTRKTSGRKYTRWKALKYFLLCLNLHEFVCFQILDRQSQPQRCAYENVLSNYTFRRNKQAGIFTHLGHTSDIHECKKKCCEKSDCDVAFMPENHCYAVSCYSDQHCETTPAQVEHVFNVKMVKVRRVVIPDPQGQSPSEGDIIRSSLPEKLKEYEKESDEVIFLNPYEELVCTHSPILYNVTLTGGADGGNFTDLGKVIDMQICITLCCEIRTCDLAFMIGRTCIAVHCPNEELCQTTKSKKTDKLPQIAYIRRKERDRKQHKVSHIGTVQNRDQPLKPVIKPAPVLRPSTCQAKKIYNNATLLGGMSAGNYTSLGRATHLQDCIGRACDLNEGHLALMLGKYCYSVTCHNERVCQTIPAKPTHLKPKVAYLAWTQEPIVEDEITSMAESDFFINHKRYPRCKRSHIVYNHTLKGGLRAGNFSMLASVDDIEVCAALCCEEKYCDLALMIGNNCYAGDCASDELCRAVPIPLGSPQRSQIAYISAPGRKKPEDRWVNADWSLVYLIVSALVIGISLLGTAWTVCLCAIRRHRRRVKKPSTDDLGKVFGSQRICSMKDGEVDMENAVGTSTKNSFNVSEFEDEDDRKTSSPARLNPKQKH